MTSMRRAIAIGALTAVLASAFLWLDSTKHSRRAIFLPFGDVVLGIRSSNGALQWVEHTWWEDRDQGGRDYVDVSMPYWYFHFVAWPHSRMVPACASKETNAARYQPANRGKDRTSLGTVRRLRQLTAAVMVPGRREKARSHGDVTPLLLAAFAPFGGSTMFSRFRAKAV